MDLPMARQKTVLGTQRPIKGATMRDRQEIQVVIPRPLMEGLVPAQGANMNPPMVRQETVLGIQSPTKGATVNLFMEGQDPGPDKDRGTTTSSQRTAPDTLELDMDKPLLYPEAVATGIPVVVGPVTVKDIQKTQVNSP